MRFCLLLEAEEFLTSPGWQSLIRGGSAPRSNPLPFYIPFWQTRYPFYTRFIEKRYPFHIPTLDQCTFSLSPWNVVNKQYYGTISSLTRRNVKQTTSVIYSVHVVKQPISLHFYIPQPEKSLPFYIPEAWKRYPFRAEPPRIGRIGVPPPPLPGSEPEQSISVTKYM